MKTKLFKTLAATAMSVLAIACAKEPVADNGQQAGVSFEIENPVVISKAGEGTTATQLYYQVFTADGQLIAGLPAQSKPLSSLKTTVTFQLVKDQTYKFIFWAQTPTAGYYSFAGTDDAKDIRTVTANYEGKDANDENFDAFFATESFKVTGPVTKTVTLKRPFAQINIGTKDQLKAGSATAPAIDFTGAKSSVTVTGVPTVFSPLAATPETMLTVPATVTFASAAIPTEPLNVKGTDYNYLAMNYVFAPAEGTVCDLSAEIVLTGREPIQLSSPTTPIKRNWRTNILGSLLTSSVDINVVVDPSFGGNEDIDLANIKNEASLKALFANGGTAKLAANIEITESLGLAAGKDLVLDLNGHNILVKEKNVVAIKTAGNLTINGDGTVDGGNGGNNVTVCALAGGKVTINGGHYTVGGDANNQANTCIYTQGGDVIINGGYFRSECTWHGRYYVLNQSNSNPGTITVNGGKFENYDPAQGDDNRGGNFVADGYTTAQTYDVNTGNTIYKVVKETVASTADDIETALRTVAGGVTTVKQNTEAATISGSSNVSIPFKNSTLRLENGAIIKGNGGTGSNNDLIQVGKGSVLNIDGNGTLLAPTLPARNQTTAINILNNGVVNVYGNITVDGGSGSNGNYAIKIVYGTANIYGGYFHSDGAPNGEASEVIYLNGNPSWNRYAKTALNVYGGIFESDGDPKYLINCYDNSYKKGYCSVKIYGGTFVGFNPADNTAEGEHTNFVADGYKSVETTYNGKQAWEVVKK